ncbi:hypothetical protein H0176_21225 [Methylorubrum populi]|uniref:Uncharacterized protein n=1 Tax=Methylorubrum rhodesianum TaxID=29427 RepID=A0ABU9ZDM3_9HYPH|nr:hypothetical protein [Methylorubrum rhodesianum]MBK3403971.1 hypothetical protein [Methylorubrum rhodesianum]MBY0142772.1 hypothetical protein [Methylorubrum populi]
MVRPCAQRHRIGAAARHLSDPALTRVFGRGAGEARGYPFSQAMRPGGLVGVAASLARCPEDPRGVVPGTRMLFAGIGDDGQLDRITGFLRQAGRRRATARRPREMGGRTGARPWSAARPLFGMRAKGDRAGSAGRAPAGRTGLTG